MNLAPSLEGDVRRRSLLQPASGIFYADVCICTIFALTFISMSVLFVGFFLYLLCFFTLCVNGGRPVVAHFRPEHPVKAAEVVALRLNMCGTKTDVSHRPAAVSLELFWSWEV